MKAILVTARAARAEALANRAALWTQVTAMVVNDLAWVAFWFIFFDRVQSVRGWDADRVMLLFSVACTAAGLALGLLANARQIGRMATDGGLDAVLTLPVPPLSYLLARRVETPHLGDVAFGLGLFVVLGHPTPGRVALYAAGVAAGVTVFTGFLVAVGSLAFFTRRGDDADTGLHALLVLATYPADVFTGGPKAVLYSLVPAAFVAAVPANLVDDFDAATALALGGAAAAFAVLGWGTFTLGLRRYTSGSAWTRA
jgi:ABC-2 type transport system permease protein